MFTFTERADHLKKSGPLRYRRWRSLPLFRKKERANSALSVQQRLLASDKDANSRLLLHLDNFIAFNGKTEEFTELLTEFQRFLTVFRVPDQIPQHWATDEQNTNTKNLWEWRTETSKWQEEGKNKDPFGCRPREGCMSFCVCERAPASLPPVHKGPHTPDLKTQALLIFWTLRLSILSPNSTNECGECS